MEDWPWEIPEGMPLAKLFGRELAPLVDVPDLDEVPLTPEELEELERLEAIVEVLEKRVEELEAKKRSEGASRDESRDESRNEPDAPAPTPTAATDADDTLAETSEEASSAPPIPATKTTRRAQPPTSPPVVALLWDVDNVNPGPDPRRAAVVAARLLRADRPRRRRARRRTRCTRRRPSPFEPTPTPRRSPGWTRALELAGAVVWKRRRAPIQVDMTMRRAHRRIHPRVDRRRRARGDATACGSMTTIRMPDDSCDGGDGSGRGSRLWCRGRSTRCSGRRGRVGPDAHLQRARAAAGFERRTRGEEWLAGNAFDRFVGQPDGTRTTRRRTTRRRRRRGPVRTNRTRA